MDRPFREEFFEAITNELRRQREAELTVLELGSGPGFLAEHILSKLPSVKMCLLDFSPAMHSLARRRLDTYADRVTNDAAGRRTHQVHAFKTGAHDVIRHIAFRDYMRAHPRTAVEYGELKQGLVSEGSNDIEAYFNGKDAFIKEHERRALLWRSSGNEQATMLLRKFCS